MKLKESIASNSIKIIDLYNKIHSGVWDTSPNFQRKLVWKKQHKYAFIDTILSNFPFPEIYIASEKMDVDNLKSQEIVVDGKQRITTIVEYIQGIGDFTHPKKVKSFGDLDNQEKKDFLNYFVTVKDLKDLDEELIKEIFQRINSTDYALNSNERINASFGDGEFAMFCKQIVDPKFKPSENDTDILLDEATQEYLTSFFIKNQVFKDNDRDRMFDLQFAMILVSTILEGTYFSRSTSVNNYIQEYNSAFDNYQDILSVIIKAVAIIESLNLSPTSYWLNKANLFILLVELSKVNEHELDNAVLEAKLLELEKKVDIYFNDDEDISMISEDERKYFEFSRQGSNGLTERNHRGKVVQKLIIDSIKGLDKPEDILLEKNISYFKSRAIDFVLIKPTETGLKKRIMDATTNIRRFLQAKEFHNYEEQQFGPNNKVVRNAKLITPNNPEIASYISMYRSNGRGDYRIWFTEFDKFAQPENEILLFIENDILYALNVSLYDYTTSFG